MTHSIYKSSLHWTFILALMLALITKGYSQANVIVDLESITTTFILDTQRIAVPVHFNSSTDDINALDLWFQFNTTKFTYLESTSEQSNADVFAYYNSSNSFLSITASSAGIEDYFIADLPVLILHFIVNDPCSEILEADFFSGQTLLNGTDANLIWTTPIPAQNPISINSSPPFCVGSDITFASNDVINGQQITTYNWDLIGSTGANAVVEQNYNTPGSFTPSLTVTTEAGCIYSSSTEINIQPGPAVNFTFIGLIANEPTTFTNTTTFLEGNVSEYLWTFGDNGTSVESDPVHQYAEAGIYNVSLLAIGDNGCSSTLSQEISISSDVFESSQNQLLVYPNPAKNLVMIENSSASSVKLYNAIGQEITISNVTKLLHGLELNLAPLPAGLYQLEITPGKQIVKLVIE